MAHAFTFEIHRSNLMTHIYLAKNLKSKPRHALYILKKHLKEEKDTPLNEIHIRSSEAFRPWALSFKCA